MIINRNINKRGSYTVETAIFLPIFIICILTIAYFIKSAGAHQAVMQIMADETRYAASRAYAIKLLPNFGKTIESRVLDEVSDIDSVKAKKVKYLAKVDGNKGIISLQVNYKIGIHLPLKFQKSVDSSDSIMSRAWIGRSDSDGAFGFENMETDDDGCTVWIFPNGGNRYHNHECTYVVNEPEQRVLTPDIKQKYKACKTCSSSNLSIGSLVYCFPKYGDNYHTAACKTIQKYTITVSKRIAEERGYLPCTKCGGK